MHELEDKYEFKTGFNLSPKEGTLDIAIRYDTVDGYYNLRMEEQGIPVEVPSHVIRGILMNIAMGE